MTILIAFKFDYELYSNFILAIVFSIPFVPRSCPKDDHHDWGLSMGKGRHCKPPMSGMRMYCHETGGLHALQNHFVHVDKVLSVMHTL